MHGEGGGGGGGGGGVSQIPKMDSPHNKVQMFDTTQQNRLRL